MTTNRTFVATITVTSWPSSGAGFGFAEIIDGAHEGEQVNIKTPVVERLVHERGWGATSLGRTCLARLGPNQGRREGAPPWQLLDIAEPRFEQVVPRSLPFGLAQEPPAFGEPDDHSLPSLAERIARLEEDVRELQDAVFDDDGNDDH